MKRPTNLVKRGNVYYYRRQERNKDLWTSLRTGSYEKAKTLLDQINLKLVMADAGFGEAPRIGRRMPSVADVLAFYSKAGFPRKDGTKREGKALTIEKNNARHLESHLGKKDPRALTPSDWQRYTDKRLAEYGEGKGARTVDLEWASLCSAYRWAIRYQDETGITARPLAQPPQRTQAAVNVKHCREFQPAGGDELHNIARYFLEQQESITQGSSVFGWLTLFSALVGQRCSEMLHLRTDATSPDQPGFDDGEHLWLYRSKTHKGTASFILIEHELRECLKAFHVWRAERGIVSPWFFPSVADTRKPVLASSFSRALTRAVNTLSLPPRKPHGLRSYYVNVLRSRGVSDYDIALRCGHKTGGKLIIETYGEILPIKLDWLPEHDPPAWERWTPPAPITRVEFA